MRASSSSLRLIEYRSSHLGSVLYRSYAGRRVELIGHGALTEGDLVEIEYKSGETVKVVLAEITHYISGGHGEPWQNYSYIFAPILVDGLIQQVLVDENFSKRVVSLKVLKRVNPEDFPKEHSLYSSKKLLRPYFVQ